MSEHLLDTFGVPEYFATTTKIESTGGGCTRIYNCVTRNGVLVPVCSVVFPNAYIIQAAARTKDFVATLSVIELNGAATH